MIIIGCDFHPSFQQIAMLDTETGATEEHKLMHAGGEAENFYRKLTAPAIVGIETVGNDQWLVQLLQKLGHEVSGRGRCTNPGQLCAEAENGSTRCKTHTATADRREVSTDLDTRRRGARSSPTADAPSQTGTDTDPG